MLSNIKLIRTFFFTVLVSGGLLCLSATAAMAQVPGEDITFRITYGPPAASSFRLDRAASDNITQAIQTSVANLDPRLRAVETRNGKYSTVSGKVTAIAIDESDISVRFDSWALKSPTNGQPVEWTRADGTKFELTSCLQNGSIVQTLKAPDETISLTYTLSRRGQTLRVQFRMVNSRLPQPLTYKLVYNRAS